MKTTDSDRLNALVLILVFAGSLVACSGARTITLQPDAQIEDFSQINADRFEAALLWGAPAGALYGAGIGALRGYRMKYEFRHPE